MVREMSKDTILKKNQLVVSHAVLVAALRVLAVALLVWFAVWLVVAAVWSAAESILSLWQLRWSRKTDVDLTISK